MKVRIKVILGARLKTEINSASKIICVQTGECKKDSGVRPKAAFIQENGRH